MRKIERENTGRMMPGQDLVAAGYAGLAGTAEILRARRADLENRFSGEYLDLAAARAATELKQMEALSGIFWEKLGAAEWEPAGEGGILAALWNLSGAYETGITFSLRRIPIRQETVEICEYFDLNPYRLYSRGCVILAADNGGRLAEELEARRITAAVIGRVKDGITREILGPGGRGYLTRPEPDELGKAVPNI